MFLQDGDIHAVEIMPFMASLLLWFQSSLMLLLAID